MRAYNLLALITPLAGAYGPVGHRTIGYLAEKWLTPSAHQWISDIQHPTGLGSPTVTFGNGR